MSVCRDVRIALHKRAHFTGAAPRILGSFSRRDFSKFYVNPLNLLKKLREILDEKENVRVFLKRDVNSVTYHYYYTHSIDNIL